MWNSLTRDERIKRIRDGVRDGKSAAQIAASIGGCTRNAVIGLALRANVMLAAKITLAGVPRSAPPPKPTKAKPAAPHVPPRPNQPKLADRQPVSVPKADPMPRPAPRPVPQENVLAPVSRRLQVVELTDRTCRWPEGDPQDEDFHFCGNDTRMEGRYCKYHSRIAYQPAAERKRIR